MMEINVLLYCFEMKIKNSNNETFAIERRMEAKKPLIETFLVVLQKICCRNLADKR